MKTLNAFNFMSEKILSLVSVLFLLLNFLIWHTNIELFDSIKYQAFNLGVVIILGALLLNVHKFNFKTFVKNNVFLLLLIASITFNSFNMFYKMNQGIVDMGQRANVLLIKSLPHLLLITILYSKENIKTIVITLIIVSYLIVFYSLIPILSKHFGLVKIFNIDLNETIRAKSIFNNPNTLGEFAYIGLFISLFLIVIANKSIYKIIVSLNLPVLIYSIILSGSKTALFMSALSVLLIFAYYFYLNKNNKVFMLSLSLLMVFATLVIFKFYPSLLANLRINNNLSGRDRIWYNTLTIIQKYTYRGIGYNNFTYVYKELYNVTTSPHNLFLGVYVELGLLGLIFTLLTFGYYFIKNHNYIIINKNNKLNIYYIMINIFYLTYLIGGFTEYSFLKVQTMGIFLMFIFGFNNVLYQKEVEREKISAKVTYLLINILMIVTTYLIYKDYSKVFYILLLSNINITIVFYILDRYKNYLSNAYFKPIN